MRSCAVAHLAYISIAHVAGKECTNSHIRVVIKWDNSTKLGHKLIDHTLKSTDTTSYTNC